MSSRRRRIGLKWKGDPEETTRRGALRRAPASRRAVAHRHATRVCAQGEADTTAICPSVSQTITEIGINSLLDSVAHQRGESCSVAHEACRQAGRPVDNPPLTSYPSPAHSTATLLNNKHQHGSRAASQQAPPPPIQAQDTTEEVHGQDELLKGCPNPGSRTCRRPGVGGLSLPNILLPNLLSKKYIAVKC